MYKKILGGIAVIVVAAVAALNVNMGTNNGSLLADLSLEQVEALAQQEYFLSAASCNRVLVDLFLYMRVRTRALGCKFT